MKRKPKKPTGLIGTIQIAETGSYLEPVHWPEEKAAIESNVLKGALKGAAEKSLNLFDLVGEPSQNAEDDFDFTLFTRVGRQYLDLMEVAPLRSVGGPHAMASGAYIVGTIAEALWEEIRRKSEGYGSGRDVTIHLLLYSTDWRFRIGIEVIDLLGYWGLKRDHCFASIVYYAPDDLDRGEVVRVFPRSLEAFVGFDETRARDIVVMNADLSAAQIGPGASVEVPFVPLGKSLGQARPGLESPAMPSIPEKSSGARGSIGAISLSIPLSEYTKKERKS